MSATEVHSPGRDAAAGTAGMAGMSQYTARTLTIDAPNGTTYAYRRFGRKGTVPVVFLQHFRGNLDNWDPALVDDIAAGRQVILVDNSGVGLSTGATPHTVTGLARDVLAFTDALGLTEIDLFGFSLGGFVAQEVILLRPRLVRLLILAGTGPEGGRGFHAWSEDITSHAYKDVQGAEDVFYLEFAPTQTSQAKAKEYVARIFTRDRDRDQTPTLAVRDAQAQAITGWGIPDMSKLGLAGRHHPANPGRQRQQRHPRPDRELLPAGRAHSRCPAHHLPGRRPRLPVPVPARVRGSRSTRSSVPPEIPMTSSFGSPRQAGRFPCIDAEPSPQDSKAR